MEPLIALEGVTHAYEREPVLIDVNVDVTEGDLIGVVGPSGSGKTTLLKVIAGAIAPRVGRVERRRDVEIGYVPQVETVNWYFPITVLETVLLARDGRALPWPSRADKDEALRLLERLGIGGLADRHIRELSGGQQQRVFIARALLRRPRLILLDEPTNGIDVATRHDILHLLHELHHEGLAIVLTTHDLNGIAAHLPRLVCLNREVIAAGIATDVITPSVLERAYGAPVEVLMHAGMPVVVDHYEDRTVERRSGVVFLEDGHHEHFD